MITVETGNHELCRVKEEQQMLLSLFSAMSSYKNHSFLVLLAVNIYCLVSGDGINVTASLNPPALVVELNSAVSKPGLDSLFSLSLLSSFPENLEISEYCTGMLRAFGQRYVSYMNCLIPAARPVKMCQNCFSSYGDVVNTYKNISEKVGVNPVCVLVFITQRGKALSCAVVLSHGSCDVTGNEHLRKREFICWIWCEQRSSNTFISWSFNPCGMQNVLLVFEQIVLFDDLWSTNIIYRIFYDFKSGYSD